MMPQQTSWIKFNEGSYGFYRVNYDISLWKKLAYQLNTNHLVIHLFQSFVNNFLARFNRHVNYNKQRNNFFIF